jgi:hypothetical protein
MIIHSLVPLRICNKKGTFRVLNGFSHLQTSTNKITIVKNQKLTTKTSFLKHDRDRIVAVSRPLQIYTESANPIGTVLACFLFFFIALFFFCFLFF